jgi:hypothetical protein
LFWTISLTRMGLLIWLGAYFQAKTLGHTSQPLAGLCITFWVHLGGAHCPKTAYKDYFLVVSDYFSYKNGPNDLVRGLFSSLDIGTNNLPTCRPLCTFLDPFGGAQFAPKWHKKLFSDCFGLFLLQKWAY